MFLSGFFIGVVMIVYRVEHKKTNEGPYTGKIVSTKLTYENSRHQDNHHKNIYTDPFLCESWDSDFYCGFKTIKQFKRWFSNLDRVSLHLLGFILSKYEIDINMVIFGETQIGFIKQKAKKLETISLEKYIIKRGNK